MILPTHPSSRSHELVRLLLVLGWSVFGAFALAYYFIHYHSPTGSLKIEAVLLQTDTLEHLDYVEGGYGKGGVQYVYDQMTFEMQGEKPVPVDIKKYQRFLDKLQGDRSLVGVDDRDLVFLHEKGSRLFLYVRPTGGKSSSPKIFQEIQILKDDYRVNLHEGDSPNLTKWANFHHPGIGVEAAKIFGEGIPK